MTAANELTETRAPQSALRRCAINVASAFVVLARPVRGVHTLWPLTLQRLAIAAALAVTVFLIVMYVADAAAIRTVDRMPRWVVWCLDEITDFGKSGWFLWPLGILFLALAALPSLPRVPQLVLTSVMVRVGYLFAAVGVPGLVVTIVKRMIGRARPGVGGSLDPFLFSPFKWTAAYAGLPSGHSTTAFAVLVAFGTLWPHARAVLWIYAALIAVSRVAVKAHYPSDVLAGAVAGAVGALIVRRWFALRGLGFAVGPDGFVRPKQGPSPGRLKSAVRALLG